MAKRGAQSGLWAHLDASGVLANGTEEQIALVRKQYRKAYMQGYKRKQREDKPEFLVQLSKADGEYSRIATAAKKHKLSVSAFLRLATLSYVERTFLVPDKILIGKLAGMLESCLNDVRGIASVKTKHSPFPLEEKCDAIEQRITLLEGEIRSLFFYPARLENAVSESIRTNPELRNRLLTIITHAHRED